MIRASYLFVLALFGFIVAGPGYGEEGHAHHAHDTSGVELGVSAGYVHLEEEDEDAPGLHIHLSKRLEHEGLLEHVAVGVGGEVIFSDHEHYALMAPLTIFPWRGLVFSIAPGIEWAEHDGETESEYTTHLEAGYVFEVGDHDIGPVFGYSKTDEEEHYMVGIHLGIHL